jgi:hypothetical protein
MIWSGFRWGKYFAFASVSSGVLCEENDGGAGMLLGQPWATVEENKRRGGLSGKVKNEKEKQKGTGWLRRIWPNKIFGI